MTQVTFAFYKGPASIFGKLIRWWTLSPYSHVEIILDYEMFSSVDGKGTRVAYNPELKASSWDFVDVPVTSHEYVAIRDWAYSEMNCEYDWKGIFLSQVLFLNREHPEKWFCSEFCAAALRLTRVVLGKAPHKFSPGGLFKRLKELGYVLRKVN